MAAGDSLPIPPYLDNNNSSSSNNNSSNNSSNNNNNSNNNKTSQLQQQKSKNNNNNNNNNNSSAINSNEESKNDSHNKSSIIPSSSLHPISKIPPPVDSIKDQVPTNNYPYTMGEKNNYYNSGSGSTHHNMNNYYIPNLYSSNKMNFYNHAQSFDLLSQNGF